MLQVLKAKKLINLIEADGVTEEEDPLMYKKACLSIQQSLKVFKWLFIQL